MANFSESSPRLTGHNKFLVIISSETFRTTELESMFFLHNWEQTSTRTVWRWFVDGGNTKGVRNALPIF